MTWSKLESLPTDLKLIIHSLRFSKLTKSLHPIFMRRFLILHVNFLIISITVLRSGQSGPSEIMTPLEGSSFGTEYVIPADDLLKIGLTYEYQLKLDLDGYYYETHLNTFNKFDTVTVNVNINDPR